MVQWERQLIFQNTRDRGILRVCFDPEITNQDVQMIQKYTPSIVVVNN